MLSALLASAQIPPSEPAYTVTDRGASYRVWQRTVPVTNSFTGQITQQLQSYTELGDGMHYWDNGWVESQDLIEITPTGAEAVHGPIKASFSSDITSIGAITLTTPAGEVFQSRPIGLFYADPVSGKVARIASIQFSQGALYPPNVLVYSNVLSGLKADLMLVWAKQGFEQNLVLKQSLPRPESFGLSSATTRLQLWTVMDACPVPQEQRPVVLSSGLVDHVLTYSGCWFPVGSAFAFGSSPLPPAGQAAAVCAVSQPAAGRIAVAKSLVTIDNQTVLIEEVNYTDILPVLNALPHASLVPTGKRAVGLAARGQLLPTRPNRKSLDGPMQLASGTYSPQAVVLDYTTVTGGTSYTFSNAVTYYFPAGATFSSVTFQAGAVLKYATLGYLAVYTSITSPASGKVIFTSVDDDQFGQVWGSGNPSYYDRALIVYTINNFTLQNLQVRWASVGPYFLYSQNDTLSSSSLFQCLIGVKAESSSTVTLAGDTQCAVVTPTTTLSGSTITGTLSLDCGVVSVAMVNDPNRDSSGLDPSKNTQSECSFVIPDSSTVVAAFWNTHLCQYGTGGYDGTGQPFSAIPAPRSVGWAKSINSGATFSDLGPIPPYSQSPPMSPVATNGDAGDPVTGYAPGVGGPNGTIYLLVNPSRNLGTWKGFRLWTSTDKGASFNPVNMDVPGGAFGVTGVDKPMIKVNGADIYVAGSYQLGAGIWAAHSSNGGGAWDLYNTLDTSGPSTGPDIAITPNATVYVFWLQGSGTYPGPCLNKLRYAWLSSGAWSASHDFGITLGSTEAFADAKLLRSKNADPLDFLTSFCLPRIAIANNRMYVVYSDISSSADRGDIWLAEAAINPDHSLATNPYKRKVNNDGTATDQWDPSVAVNPTGTELFIGYYSRQNDPNNSNILAYGAKANISGGLSNATFDCIPISPTAFPPLFAGTTAPASGGWAYDPVFPQSGVCLDQNAIYVGASSGGDCTLGVLPTGTGNEYIHFCADDYTWVSADSSYFYFAWCDRSRTFGTAPNIRPDADVKFAKIKQ